MDTSQDANPAQIPTPGMAEHLGMIQGIINRMAANSFQIKGWTVTLLAALGATGVASQYSIIFLLGYLPLIIFWGLDGYFLRQEKIYRAVYERVRGRATIDFDMKPQDEDRKNTSGTDVIFSKTLFPFYGSLLTLYATLFLIFHFSQNTCA